MYCMKRYSVALVRERLAEALNEVDRGIPVVIERRGVRYRVTRVTGEVPDHPLFTESTMPAGETG